MGVKNYLELTLFQELIPCSHQMLQKIHKCSVQLGIVTFQAFQEGVTKKVGAAKRSHPSFTGTPALRQKPAGLCFFPFGQTICSVRIQRLYKHEIVLIVTAVLIDAADIFTIRADYRGMLFNKRRYSVKCFLKLFSKRPLPI